ncbi:Cytochrome P450 [Dillenia turbinata]|uniref:Cytochrome P450 n=1 Tax=Dillenia turbinata TaxID=194707 RepID=A0AAN8ZNF1_9MAGN
MSELELLASLFLLVLSFIYFFFFFNKNQKSDLPKSYPLIGSYISMFANRHRRIQWLSDLVKSSPSATYTLHRPFGIRQILTGNPNNVRHILKTRFDIYTKGDFFKANLYDFLGNGIFNIDGENWKFQRQVSSHEFNTKTLRKFTETVVDTELFDRLIPVLLESAQKKTVLDFQDVLQRFAFDNICKISFGYDPNYLLPCFPQAKFACAFDEAANISTKRLNSPVPNFWKVMKILNFGSERKLKIAVSEVRKFAQKIVREKKEKLEKKSEIDSFDLLSRFLISGHYDEEFVTDIVISFTLAGRDTTSGALTWFFWLLSKNPNVEEEILKEIRRKAKAPVFDEVKGMVYTHASLCESMRLYPPVPADSKEAESDDVLPDGTVVKKGMRVTYVPYAMGRMESLWGEDWNKFRPERWLERDLVTGQWVFVQRDSYTYSVFQAGPRICLGREMAFLQMKKIVAGVVGRFRVVPTTEDGFDPIFTSALTSRMEGGFPVKIELRTEDISLTRRQRNRRARLRELVTRARALRCMETGPAQAGGLVGVDVWLARSKSGVGSCFLGEGLGCVIPRAEENASGWFHRAANTSRSGRWKDYEPALHKFSNTAWAVLKPTNTFLLSLSLPPSFTSLSRFEGHGGGSREKRIRVSRGIDIITPKFARKIVREKKEELEKKSEIDSVDLLSRFLISGQCDEDFVTDIVISFILAGKDSTSAALTWFFWLLSKNPNVEEEILKEIGGKTKAPVFDEVKDMVYTHASLCESMRLYPPIPFDSKGAESDDILPDGTVVKKGMRVTYVPYAMGRMESLWGEDWNKFRPERWLERDPVTGKWVFVPIDPYTYCVFQAGPRICLGREMAFLQMKKIVAGVVGRIRVVPVAEDSFDPVYTASMTSKMEGGFPVKIEVRAEE